MAIKEIFVLITIGLSVCIASNECPPKEDMAGCQCWKVPPNLEINCRGEDTGKTIQDYRKIFQENNFAGKRNIKLRFSRFSAKSRVPSKVFEGYHIIDLEFYASNFSKWADEEGGPAFIGLEDSLEKLTFDNTISMGSKYGYQSQKAPMSLSHLRKLLEVDFNFNHLYTFANGWFEKGPGSLKVLKLNFCQTRSIGNRAFAGLTNLKKIELKSNKIEEISRTMFSNPASHLEEIDLSSNKLTALPDDIFSNMPLLARVDLSSNVITHIPETVWRPVWSKLRSLNLAFTRLNCDDHIDWIFKVRPPKFLWAICYEPEHMNFVDLEVLIKEKQKET